MSPVPRPAGSDAGEDPDMLNHTNRYFKFF
jgi:hypothetical protein